MYPFIHVFGKSIGSYALVSLIGFLLSALMVYHHCKKKQIDYVDLVLMLVFVTTGIVVGGHLLYGITHFERIVQFFADFTDLKTLIHNLSIAFGGMVFYGGFIGSVAAVYLYTHFFKEIDRPFAFDMLALSTPLFHTFGRIGCFLGGCCYGVECSWGITVHNNPVLPELNDVTRFPVQLVEAGCNLMIFGLLLLLFRRKSNRLPLLSCYVFLYAPVRFTLEFLRGDVIRGFWMGLSTSQWISLLLLSVALLQILINHRRSACIRPKKEI